MNQEKARVYDKNWEIFHENESSYIQKYGKNEDGSLQAWKHIEQD